MLLESARTRQRKRSDGLAGAYELLATAALTGARPSELLRLTAEDVSFDRNTILIRGTKTDGGFRSVPFPPPLKEILEPYLTPADRTPVFVQGAPLRQPNGIAFDPQGNIVVIMRDGTKYVSSVVNGGSRGFARKAR